jgi:hypothetical protein
VWTLCLCGSFRSGPLAAGGKGVSYADVVKLLDLGIDEQEILKRLAKSPTLFTLGADQVDELKKKGARATLVNGSRWKIRELVLETAKPPALVEPTPI